MNNKRLFNDGWEFAKSTLETESVSDLKFESVDIPHDWLIYDTLNLYKNSIGWYRKRFTYIKGNGSNKKLRDIESQSLLPDFLSGNGSNKQVFLCFDGVYMDSYLYVNQQFAGEWKYGYSTFEHEITDALVDGENEVLMKVVYQSPNSRWYSGAGIYRNVWLKQRETNHIITDGIYITTKQKDNGWQLEIGTDIEIFQKVQISHTLLYKGQFIATSESFVSPDGQDISHKGHCSSVQPGSGIIHNEQTLFMENPLLWSTNAPNLYQLVTRLHIFDTNQDTKLIESISHNIGFREVVFDPKQGFVINGTRMKLNGVCKHHDLGALGAAFNKTALRRRLAMLKEMGVNAVRTAHNMPAPELMDLADEMGIFVVSEAFDVWERSKTPYDYARFFKEYAAEDIKSWVMRDRNHPSLIMWSIGNEIYDTHVCDRGQEVTKMLMEEVLKYDPKENARVTIGSNYMPWENAQKCADIVKVVGYNYAEKYYKKHHEEHPDWIIYGSETGAVVQSRGVYHFPFEKSILAEDDEQCSALGNSSTSWGAKSAQACILVQRDMPFSLGQFIWTGFDYIGEPTPYHTKNSYFGQIDTAGFKKDSYYIYQAAWTHYKTNPMVHIFPYWDFNKGQIIDVRVCSNAPVIELQFNGASIGFYKIDCENGDQLIGLWKLPYEKGEIKAIAYDEAGKIIATDIRKSFGEPKRICLEADKEKLIANGLDLIFIEISMMDECGNPVENANNRVSVHVTGEGRLIGLDNGDSTDYDQYKGLSRRLFNGKLMVIIGATLSPGKVWIEVSSKGLESCAVEFESYPSENGILEGISACTKSHELPCVLGSYEEIPLRKIEIISDSGQVFDETMKDMVVHARLYPENASYSQIEWSVTDDAGIASNIAQVEALGQKARLTALSDGEFRLRCSSRNGSSKIRLISQLEFKAVGLGIAYKDPYGFICAGLYDYCKGEIGNGNEKGIATSRDGETQIGFYGIDFGSYGSDTITIPIFALTNEKYYVKIWEGIPDKEGSLLLADVIYQKETKWNVYQEETYRLSKRLQGVTTICFVLHQKVHIKGFSFKKKNRAFEKNMVKECDSIYGDRYKITDSSIEDIGNNVSVEFNNIDFTNEGAKRIIIYGRSHIDKNTIQIRFGSIDGGSMQMIEFPKSDIYEERAFDIERITGLQKVTFIFLPGCNFDFGWFRFEKTT
jgi:beta-galactosidase